MRSMALTLSIVICLWATRHGSRARRRRLLISPCKGTSAFPRRLCLICSSIRRLLPGERGSRECLDILKSELMSSA